MFLTDLFQNPIFLAPAFGWCVAQVTKVIPYLIINREFRLERMFGDGGMPSAHSATVSALVVATAMRYGAGGFELPMAGFFAFIVMHDAMGVRRETGRQAEVINDMIEEFKRMNAKGFATTEDLKELVGHSPLQVLVGSVLGIVVGLIVSSIVL